MAEVADTSRITEEEARRYDRSIRTWGIDAQTRMRASTLLIIGLRSIAAEAIKNVLLAGVGKLIVMDDQDVVEEDLGAGLLFREEEGAIGKKRVEAALPQMQSLNPYVDVAVETDLGPFAAGGEEEIVAWLEKYKIDLVCATDMNREQMIKVNAACRKSGKMFYGAGGYGFNGFVFADLGTDYECVSTVPGTTPIKLTKKKIDFVPFGEALGPAARTSHNPFRGVTRNATKQLLPAMTLCVLAVWEYQAKHDGSLPSVDDSDAEKELTEIAEGLRRKLEVNEKALPSIPSDTVSHFATAARHEFAPTSAIVGGILGSDILRAIGRKENPIVNLLVIDTLQGNAVVTNWGAKEAQISAA